MQTSLGAPRPVAVPTSVRIKRQRDEPSLPGLVLSGGPTKRPSLASLSISSRLPVQQAESSPDQAPPARCYRLVATVLADGRTLASPARETGAADMAAQKRQARHEAHARQQTAARFARVRSSRLGGVSELDSGVLELQRIADLPRRAPLPPAKHKLRPFGPPIPSRAQLEAEAAAAEAEPRSRGGGWGWADPADSGEEAAMWRDAAAAAAEEADGAGGRLSAGEGEEVVFDLYELVGEDASARFEGAESAECDAGGPGSFERIWWEECEDELVTDPDEAAAGSGSEGDEVDYPEDEESERESASSGSDGGETDEDAGFSRRYNFQL